MFTKSAGKKNFAEKDLPRMAGSFRKRSLWFVGKNRGTFPEKTSEYNFFLARTYVFLGRDLELIKERREKGALEREEKL